MRFLFIYPSTGVLGGIETLLARMSRWLIENGHQVTLLVEQPGEWTELLPQGVKCIILDRQFPKLYYYIHAKHLWNSWIACQLARIMQNNCKVIAGIYNPYVFTWYWAPESLPPWSTKWLYLRNYLKYIPASARVFCGIDQIEELKQVHHQGGILWPIPIDTTQFLPASRKPQWGRIVSVGRLSPMKDYNFYMFDVITSLRKKGYDVTWSVYGTGEYENRMRDRIEQDGLQQVVFMEGSVPYNRFWKVLEDAYVFVGMGTAILEAALFKVPNVNALAYDREGITHGSVYRFPPGCIGPSLASPAKLRVVDEIERILRLGSAEYQTEAELAYAHMRDHIVDNSMNHFLKLVREAGPIRTPQTLYLSNYPLWFVRRVMKRLVRPRETIHPGSTLPAKPVNV